MGKIRMGTWSLLLLVGLVLTACGKSGGGGDGDGNGVPPVDEHSISGTVRAAKASNLTGLTVELCRAGTDCSQVVDTVQHRERLGQSQRFEFRDVPEGSYDVRASVHVEDQAGERLGIDEAMERNIRPGTTDVNLQLEFAPIDPTDGSAAMSGILHLPGGLSGAALEDGAAAPVTVSARTIGAADDDVGLLQVSSLSNDLHQAEGLEAMPGEVIVRFRNGELSAQSAPTTLAPAGVQLNLLSTGPAGHLYSDPSLSQEETVRLAEELSARPDVESATPNWILHAFAEPNDELYRLQWHYRAINLPPAWDTETGSSNRVTVAVVDSGSIPHEDLRFLPGYDFITDPALAGDGGGRDANPEDPGRGSNYHGAHVAGTVGALTNNENGVAGVNWNVDLVPVRALGVDGKGALFDIMDGIRWAAGRPVSGVPRNANPARVINLSLGVSAGMKCEQVMPGAGEFFTGLRDDGVIVVVAAGNDNVDTAGVFPANCPGVITVGASGPENKRAPYSNYGREVDVMAPGGDLNASFAQDGRRYPFGVLSTVRGSDGKDDYAFFQGTSMAAPHVAGVISLMLSQEPRLSFNEVLTRLQNSTSDPVCSDGCGEGLIDAAAALSSSGSDPIPPPPPLPEPEDATTYILLSKCTNNSCSSYRPHEYLAFPEIPPGDIRYLASKLSPGTYRVEAWQDFDGNSNPANGIYSPNPGEPHVVLPSTVRLEANKTTTGIDFDLTIDVAD